jgi:glutamine---fructose-6-phosphate transaminase (isomerizing)
LIAADTSRRHDRSPPTRLIAADADHDDGLVNAADFLADLEAKPSWLERLAGALSTSNPFASVPTDVDRVLLLGMGSSRYAAVDAALDLRAAGLAAAAEYASVEATFPPDPRTLVIAISASGASAETLDAVERYRGRSPILVLTNDTDSELGDIGDVVVDLLAGEEIGGIACRSFLHTALLLRSVGAHLTGVPEDVATLTHRVAASTSDLHQSSAGWLETIADLLDGPDGVALIAPVERSASAEQGALMIREGPRRPATAAETADWAHVDVYLAKTLDYRALLFMGSRWDSQAIEWLTKRDATVVAVGSKPPGFRYAIRYSNDGDPDVARYTEVLVPELIAAYWWGTEAT